MTFHDFKTLKLNYPSSWLLFLAWKVLLYICCSYWLMKWECSFCLHVLSCCWYPFPFLKYLSFRKPHICILSVWATDIILRKWSPVLMRSMLLLTFSSLKFSWLDLYWGLWSIWTWVLCMRINMELFWFFYMLTSSYTNPICWRFFFIIV